MNHYETLEKTYIIGIEQADTPRRRSSVATYVVHSRVDLKSALPAFAPPDELRPKSSNAFENRSS
jgi:hypothetical protein